ncbi:hypothetical protein CJ030_MR4G025763 [Morella rubra]|uniref:Uncharacterized protein n=1 Tax=Morella rubra TaxID=262757 RepID=A0A6A1VUG5_9ROSI|nr:hypothetical protein CJ030_MR4G025763 [Morella rubra]
MIMVLMITILHEVTAEAENPDFGVLSPQLLPSYDLSPIPAVSLHYDATSTIVAKTIEEMCIEECERKLEGMDPDDPLHKMWFDKCVKDCIGQTPPSSPVTKIAEAVEANQALRSDRVQIRPDVPTAPSHSTHHLILWTKMKSVWKLPRPKGGRTGKLMQ